MDINRHALFPDLTILIKVRPEVALERITAGRLGTELFERRTILAKVLVNFERLTEAWQTAGKTVAVVDGEQPAAQVTAALLEICQRRLQSR
jgi:thymidylate kinase